MSREDEPEWTAENMNRSVGDTDFDICGWCKHRNTGSFRYDCMVSGNCSLMKDYANDTKWNTKCKIKNLSKEDFDALIRSKKYKIEENERSIKYRKKEMKELKKLKARAIKKPCLANSRRLGDNDYPLGDTVHIFIPKGDNVPKSGWYKGTVVSGYRTFDGCVSYVIDELPKSAGGWGCGAQTPTLLKDWEFEYFQNNIDEFKAWMDVHKDEAHNGNEWPWNDIVGTFERFEVKV